MQKLTFITGNAGKAKYLSDYFHLSVEHLNMHLSEIQSLDLKEIVGDKARHAFEIVQGPVIVEDTSLIFTSLHKLPGPLIKWFLESLGNDGLCKLLGANVDRTATAAVEFAYCDHSGVHTFGASRVGTISREPRGEAGFGWDQIFIPEGHKKTWAEMDDDEKHATSMRRPALEKLSKFLGTI